MLDDPFPAVATRQVQIDIRPLATLFRQKALEEQVHPDRIDRGNTQAVTDSAIGGRAASLHENVLLSTEIHEIPHDQEIASQIERPDEIELARDLSTGAFVIRAIALTGADLGDGAENEIIVSPVGTG